MEEKNKFKNMKTTELLDIKAPSQLDDNQFGNWDTELYDRLPFSEFQEKIDALEVAVEELKNKFKKHGHDVNSKVVIREEG